MSVKNWVTRSAAIKWTADQAFEASINQAPGAGANNETPFAQYGDLFNDFVKTGLLDTVPSPASLTSSLPAGLAYVLGQRVVKLTDTPYTYAPSSDTYVDLSDGGALTYSAVANGATAPSVAANSLRLEKIVTSATAITAVAPIALQGSPYIKFRAYRYAAFTTGANAVTTIPLDTVQYNNGPASLLGADGLIHVPVAGYYSVCGVFMSSGTQSTNVTVATILSKNGANDGESIYGDQVNINGIQNSPASSVSGLMYLTPSDTLSLLVYTQVALPLANISSVNFVSIVGPF